MSGGDGVPQQTRHVDERRRQERDDDGTPSSRQTDAVTSLRRRAQDNPLLPAASYWLRRVRARLMRVLTR